MADNYVQIRIKASDTAKPELDSLRADLDELGSKVDSAKVDVNDDDAKRKLLEINAELAALNKRVANPKIDAAGAARAESRIEKLKGNLEDLTKKADTAPTGGILGKLLFGALGKLPGGGEGGGAGGILGNLSGLSAGGAAGAFGIGAILVELDGLVSGFAAAGAGVGAFAVLAMPAFDKVKTAITSLKTDQLAYANATTAAAKSSALKKIHDDWKALDPAERGAVKGVQAFMSTFDKMSKAFEPQAFKVFNDALKIANTLLPDLKPFADTAATALDGLLKQVGKFAGSTGFKDWLKQFQKLEGPSITAIGHGIGQVAIAMGKLLTIMSSKDVVNSINIAFKILAGTINALGFVIRRIMLRWDQWQQLVKQVARDTSADAAAMRRSFDDMRHGVASDFDSMRHAVADWGHNLASIFDEARANIHRWAADFGRDVTRVVDYFRALPGRIMSALSSLGGRLFSAGAHIISMLASGIRSAIGDVVGAIGSVVGEITSHLPFSPAKKGPLSGRGSPDQAGKRIAQMLAQGMDEGRGAVSGAADRIAGAASTGAHGGAGGRGQIVLEFHVPTALAAQLSPQFWTAFANGVRAKGGSAGIVTRKVSFA